MKYIKKYFSIKVERLPFKRIDYKDINIFNSIVGKNHTLSKHNDKNLTSKDFDLFNIDYLKEHKGSSEVVLYPSTTEEISEILKYCSDNKIAVCPQSGNTGLVVGSNPIYDEVIIKMTRFNKIHSFDPISNTLHCEAGVVLENIANFLKEYGYCPPIDIASKGSCMIGGNISTNAGGIHFVKYGSMRKNVKGLKAVLPQGEIINSMNPLPKNNTGYDLKQMFIGSEGTLGIITECLINCYPIVKNKQTSLIKFNSYPKLVDFYVNTRNYYQEKLYAIEFFDDEAMRLTTTHMNTPNPFNSKDNKNYYLLLEVESSSTTTDDLENFINSQPSITDAIISNSESQTKEIWRMREMILEACVKSGPSLIYDISLDLRLFESFIDNVREICKDNNFTVVGFGHIGDYNLHINIVDEQSKSFDRLSSNENKNKIEEYIFNSLQKINGSISAEHGIGSQKVKYLNKCMSELNIKMMRDIKKSLDPEGIMNPYKIFI